MGIHLYADIEPSQWAWLTTALTDIQNRLTAIEKGQTMAQATLDDLQNEVTSATTIEQGAITLIQGIAAQLAAAKNDPVKIQAIADQLKSQDDALASAIAANTPAAA